MVCTLASSWTDDASFVELKSSENTWFELRSMSWKIDPPCWYRTSEPSLLLFVATFQLVDTEPLNHVENGCCFFARRFSPSSCTLPWRMFSGSVMQLARPSAAFEGLKKMQRPVYISFASSLDVVMMIAATRALRHTCRWDKDAHFILLWQIDQDWALFPLHILVINLLHLVRSTRYNSIRDDSCKRDQRQGQPLTGQHVRKRMKTHGLRSQNYKRFAKHQSQRHHLNERFASAYHAWNCQETLPWHAFSAFDSPSAAL